MEYREIKRNEAKRIQEIDARWTVKNAWRIDPETNQYELVEINWTTDELPNGYSWHLKHIQDTMSQGGKAFGCFDQDRLVGYVTLDAKVFGMQENYVLMDQLFISQPYRKKGVGRSLVELCKEQAIVFGADKIYICAASAEETVAFYKKIGCKLASEVNQELYNQDPMDIPMELLLI